MPEAPGCAAKGRGHDLSVYTVLRDHLVRQQGKRGWRATQLAWRQTCEYREAVVVVNATLAKLKPRITTKVRGVGTIQRRQFPELVADANSED